MTEPDAIFYWLGKKYKAVDAEVYQAIIGERAGAPRCGYCVFNGTDASSALANGCYELVCSLIVPGRESDLVRYFWLEEAESDEIPIRGDEDNP